MIEKDAGVMSAFTGAMGRILPKASTFGKEIVAVPKKGIIPPSHQLTHQFDPAATLKRYMNFKPKGDMPIMGESLEVVSKRRSNLAPQMEGTRRYNPAIHGVAAMTGRYY